MPEQKEILYTRWEKTQEIQKQCYECFKKKDVAFGEMLRRRVTGRDGETHAEYKVECPRCEEKSKAYRSPRLAIADWEAKWETDDKPKRRNRRENDTL